MSEKNVTNDASEDYMMVKSKDYKTMLVKILGDNKLLKEKIDEYKNTVEQMMERLDGVKQDKNVFIHNDEKMNNYKQTGGSVDEARKRSKATKENRKFSKSNIESNIQSTRKESKRKQSNKSSKRKHSKKSSKIKQSNKSSKRKHSKKNSKIKQSKKSSKRKQSKKK